MAQFFTDFTGASVGADPPAGWTARWDATTNWRVGTGPLVEWEAPDSTSRFDVLSWDTVGSVSGEIDVFAEFRTSDGTGAQLGVAIQAQTGATSGYAASINFGGSSGFDEVAISRLDAGVESGLGGASFVWALDTLYQMRLRKFSDDIVRVRVWAAAGSEPGTWNFSTTADTSYSSGVVGLFARNEAGVKTWTKFGVGTAGDAAPTSAPSGTSIPVIAAGLRQRMNN